MIGSAGVAQTAPVPDETRDVTKLGGVTVTDTAIVDNGYKVDTLDSPKFTAPLLDTPRSITVIPSQVLKDTASTTLVEALRTVPGITLGAGEGGNPLGDRPFIRGFDSQASTYLDGVPDIGAQSRETFDVDRIEVVKGSDSVNFGGSNAGGSINIVSKAPTADRFVEASGTYGSADYKRGTIDINQPVSDLIGVRLNAMWHDQNVAGRDAIFQKRWGIAPSVKIGLDGPTSLTFGFYHLKTNELPDSGIPYLYTIANQPTAVNETAPANRFTTIAGQEVDVPRGAYYGLKDRDFRHTKVNDFTIRAQHAFDDGLTIRNTARYTRTDQGYFWTQPDDSQGNVYGTNAANAATSGNKVWRRSNSRYGYADGMIDELDLYGKASTFGLRHSFTGSLQYSAQQSEFGTYVSNPATGAAVATGSTVSPRCSAAMIARYNCTSAGDPDPSDPWVSYASDTSTATAAIQKSLPKTRTLTRANTKSASLFDTITITDALLVNLGGRYDHYSTNVGAGLTATSNAARTWVKRVDDLWTYQAGIVFKPRANGSIYASTSTAATPPGSFLAQGSEDNALSATIDPDILKVQKTTSYEVGTKWSLFDDGLLLSLAAFHTRTTNARTTDANGLPLYVGTRRIRGFEFGYTGTITPAWTLFGGYTYLDSKILDAGQTYTSGIAAPAAATGHQFPNTPKHSFTAFTNYKVTPALTVGGGAIYMAKVYGGYSDTRVAQNGQVVITKERATYVPHYWRFDANASYQLTPLVRLQVNALNLTNTLYYDKAYATHYANEAAGRTILGTISVRY